MRRGALIPFSLGLATGIFTFYFARTSWINDGIKLVTTLPEDIAVITHDKADVLSKKVRVLCWVMTNPNTTRTRAATIKKTWGTRCNILLFISSKDDAELPAIGAKSLEGRTHLTEKVWHALLYSYKHHLNDADWFMKSDDDAYVIMENLRLMLSEHSPDEPVHFGHHFRRIVKPQGFHSGGPGYVLSKEAVRRFGQFGYHNTSLCPVSGVEDVDIGECMQSLGIKVVDTYDKHGRSRFHSFTVARHLRGNYPDWYNYYDSHGGKSGIDSISKYAVSFHYVTPEEMWNLEFYTNRLRIFGRGDGDVTAQLHQYYWKDS